MYAFFMEHYLFLKKQLTTNYSVHSWAFGKHFCKIWMEEICHFKVTDSTINQLNTFQDFQAKIRILKICICHHELGLFSILKDFSGEIGGHINEYDILMLYNTMSQYLEDLHNSVNHYLSNDQYMILYIYSK